MKLKKPKINTFWIAVILGVLGIIARFVSIPILSGFPFWLVVAGFLVLIMGNLVKGL